jgi:hypothetical protein
MAVGTTTSTSTTQIDPTIQPYLKYGLEEAQRLYQAGGPQYYSGQGYVGPSEATQTGIQALEARSRVGNPLLGQAQNVFSQAASAAYNPALGQYQNLYQNAGRDPASQFYSQAAGGAFVNPALAQTNQTAQGAYLGGNQFFQGAFNPAAEAATTAFNQSINDVTSNASKAGRYGSGAMNNLQNSAANTLAKNLTGTAGQLAFQNYSNERAAQEAAQSRLGSLSQQGFANQMAGAQQLTSGAQNKFNQQLAATGGLGGTYQSASQQQLAAAGQLPQLAEADYADINKQLAAGQLREGYQNQALQADMARYAYEQNLPQQQLTNYLNQAYGFPAGRTSTSQQPYFTNPTASAFGTGLLGMELLNKASPYLSKGYNYLTGGSSGFQADPNAYSFGSNWWD